MADERRHGNRPGPGGNPGPGGKPGPRGPQRQPPGQSPRPGGPSRSGGQRSDAPHRSQSSRTAPITPPTPKPNERRELPMAVAPEEVSDEGMVYIAYGENGDDIAFELCDDLEEAFGVYAIMREDGFKPRLFQASEIEIVED